MKNKEMKLSRYAFECRDGENIAIYSAASDNLLVLIPQLYGLYSKHVRSDSLAALEGVHPDFYNALRNIGVIVPQGIDEGAELVKFVERQDNSPASFTVTVNPTLDCNLRCWYCYEKKNKGSRISEQVFERLRRLIATKVANPELRELNLSFFGGEPLMQFAGVIRPLIEYADALCEPKGIALKLSFTTNATLLTRKAVEFLKPFNERQPIFWQITLDGNREAHNATKFEGRKGDAFTKTVDSIHTLVKNGMSVRVRLNYTGANIETFVDVIPEFADLSDAQKKALKFDFHRVWQDKSAIRKERLNYVKEAFKSAGFVVMADTGLSSYRCYADMQNCIVVNYNGDIFKCTAREFAHELREGDLLPDGTVNFNPLYERRMRMKFVNPTCRECRILPLCWGGCTQHKVERDLLEGCYLERTEEDKAALVTERIKELMAL